MGGCTNCQAKTGCDDRKGDMLATVDRTLAELYPTRTWGEARELLGAGISRDELAALADELASVLGAATFLREGDDSEACDFLYVLCMGRTPCLVQVRDHGVTLLCGAPAVVNSVLDAAQEWEGDIPGAGRTRIVVAGAPPPTRTIERVETELDWEFIQIYGLTET